MLQLFFKKRQHKTDVHCLSGFKWDTFENTFVCAIANSNCIEYQDAIALVTETVVFTPFRWNEGSSYTRADIVKNVLLIPCGSGSCTTDLWYIASGDLWNVLSIFKTFVTSCITYIYIISFQVHGSVPHAFLSYFVFLTLTYTSLMQLWSICCVKEKSRSSIMQTILVLYELN